MKKKKIKILFLLNTITSYQVDFFSELSKISKIRVIFIDKNYNNYNFNFKRQKNFFFLDKEKKKSSKIREIISEFNPDFSIIGGYRLSYSNQIIQLLKKKNKRYFFWLERLNRLNLIKYKITNFLIKIICQGSTGIFSVGNEARNNYLKYHNSVFNLPYSINIHKFNKKKAFFKNDKVNFLFVGQLIKRKGIDLILKSFSMLSFKEKKKINLTIIGDGPYKEKIKKLTKKNKYLSYQNFLNRQKLIPIYGKNDVFIFPSTFDGWGVAPLEAMASSMSLILSKNVGMNEILKMRDGNEFVKCSPYQLLHSIKKLIKNRKKIVINGKKNRAIIEKSLCNAKISSKALNDYLENLI